MSKDFLEKFQYQFDCNLKHLLKDDQEESEIKKMQKKYRNLIQLFETMQEEQDNFKLRAKDIELTIKSFPRKDKQEALYKHFSKVEQLFDSAK